MDSANGHGQADIVVGARDETVDSNSGQGRVYVFLGADGSLLRTMSTPNPQPNADFGVSLATRGVNREGRADIVIGTASETVGGNAWQGRAYAFSAADGSLLLTLTTPNPQPSLSDHFGMSVAVDAGASNDAGHAYVFSGLPLGVGGVAAQPDVAALPSRGTGASDERRVAYMLGGAAGVLLAIVGGAWAVRRRRAD